MTIDVAEWFNLVLRWVHVTAGIAWIGSSFYFVWLDNHLKPPATGEASGELWSVHGGGFYHNQKYQVAPAQMPGELHWFKWEAYFTWLSGFSLLVLIYFFGAQSYLIDAAKSAISTTDAVALALASLAGGWVVYDLLCRSPLGRDNRVLGVVWFSLLVGLAAFLNSLLNSKAVYIQLGAIVGTVMAANVFFVIIPNQKKVVADLVAGRSPDPKLGQQAKQRSVHNNYMTLPVLFMMISQHYPITYGANRPWLVLALIALTGVAVRHVFNLRHRGKSSPLLFASIGMLIVLIATYVGLSKQRSVKVDADAGVPTFATVQPIIEKHCSTCHSSKPSDPAFAEPPLGLVLDTFDQAKAAAPKIKHSAVDTDTMPLGNTTGMTGEERGTLGKWIASGAPK
jgi:uncharacterized membrane protein